MSLKKIMAVSLAAVCCTAVMFGCKQVDPTVSADETTTAANTEASETETETETEAETVPALPADETTLRIAAGEMQKEWNPLFATAEGDRQVVDLIGEYLVPVARGGELIYTTADGKSVPFMGQNYSYKGLAEVGINFNTETNETVYSITLRDGVCFSDGTPITSDDLIFTYYLLCDPAYDGPFKVDEQLILGMQSYQLNNSAAPGISVTSAEVSALLENPTEDFKNAVIEQITRPVLEEERDWCKENWQAYVDRGFGNSPEEFFATLYTYSAKADYDIEGKSLEEIVEDTIALYGMNYKQLAKNYQGDLEFFDAQVKKIAENFLYDKKVTEAGGTEVANIQGITRVDDRSITITCLGYNTSRIYDLCHIYVLPLHYYGDSEQYNYEENRFGFTRGDLTAIREKAAEPLGAGPYCLLQTEGDTVYLTANDNYHQGTPSLEYLKLVPTDSADALSAVADGELDLARVSLDRESTSAIAAVNGDMTLNGDKITVSLIGDNDYFYFGFNVSKMKVGEDANSEASKALRKAFAVVLAANRQMAAEGYYGQHASVIEYSYTTDNWAAMNPGVEGYTPAFTLDVDNNEIFTPEMSPEERANAAKNAAMGYLTMAGYTFDAATDTFTAAPEGGKMEFTALLPYYFPEDSGMAYLMNNMKSTFESIGFTVNIQTAENLDEFVWLLSEKSADIWAGERATTITPQLSGYYSSNGSSNFYGLSIPELDTLLDSLSQGSAIFAERVPTYHQVFTMLRDQVVEIPAMECRDGIAFNAERINGDALPVLSGYYNWTDAIMDISLK